MQGASDVANALLQPVEFLRVPIAESLRQRVAAAARARAMRLQRLPGFVRLPLKCCLCSGASRSCPLQPRPGHGLAPAQ